MGQSTGEPNAILESGVCEIRLLQRDAVEGRLLPIQLYQA